MKALFASFAIIFIPALFACHYPRTKEIVKIKNDSTKTYAKEPNDSADYKYIKYDFYLSKDGNLCERKLQMAWDSTCNCEFQVYYDSSFLIFLDDTVIKKPLKSIVDINSFIWLDSTQFSKDKNRVYYFHGNSDGGLRVIVDKADPITFKRLCEYRWGIDKNYVFYKTDRLNGLDLKKLKVLYPPDTSDRFIQYIKDDKTVFFENQIVKDADAKTFKVVSGQRWDAEDKNYKYETGNRHHKDTSGFVSFVTKLNITDLDKDDAVNLKGYVVNIGYEQLRKLNGKKIRITGKVTIIKASKNRRLGQPIQQQRQGDYKYIESPKIEIIKG